MQPGSTVEIGREDKPEGEEPEVKITIQAPPAEKAREPVGVGAKGEAAEGEEPDGGSMPEASGGGELPEEPEVLPDVPDAPPADDEPVPPSES
jgi:hypothetical protein